MKLTWLLIVATLILPLVLSCATFEEYRFEDISIGMTKEEVKNELGKPLDIIGKKKYEKGIIEVWEYREHSTWDLRIEARHWLFFLNDKLEDWIQAHAGGSWQDRADRIYYKKIR